MEAKRLRGKTLDVWVVFEVKTEIEFQNGKSANNSIVFQAHKLADVVDVRGFFGLVEHSALHFCCKPTTKNRL
ncbi:hypothetical protein VAE122_2920077 [Vibrio aestuarianus]|nr:hypothetical protein VAE122_2920077 [Vibrio aestuarianus]